MSAEMTPGFRGVLGKAMISARESQVKPEGEYADKFKQALDRIGKLLDKRLEERR